MSSTFEAALAGDEPPADWSDALQGLFWAERGEWERAHALVMGESGDACAWVHACLHREEEDLLNADYWYRRAGKERPGGDLREERRAIAAELLSF